MREGRTHGFVRGRIETCVPTAILISLIAVPVLLRTRAGRPKMVDRRDVCGFVESASPVHETLLGFYSSVSPSAVHPAPPVPSDQESNEGGELLNAALQE
jgi:hypothetical protein